MIISFVFRTFILILEIYALLSFTILSNISVFHIDNDYMEPNFLCGESIIAINKNLQAFSFLENHRLENFFINYIFSIGRGDLIILKTENKEQKYILQRIIGEEGDKVEYQCGSLLVNNNNLFRNKTTLNDINVEETENGIYSIIVNNNIEPEEIDVKKGNICCLPDNRLSNDTLKVYNRKNIVYIPLFKIVSFNKINTIFRNLLKFFIREFHIT